MGVEAQADYAEEIREHMHQIQSAYPDEVDRIYFRDMGVVARKADESDMNVLTNEIIRTHLFTRMDDYIEASMDEVDRRYEVAADEMTRLVNDLKRYERYYEPTDEFQQTTGGQAFANEMIRIRGQALQLLTQGCSETSMIQGLQAVRKSGLYITNTPEEIRSLRQLNQMIDCCFAWKSQINYRVSTDFESEYEEGVVTESAKFKLMTNPNSYTEAKWVGEWIYEFEGREGTGKGLSQTTLKYRKGDLTADLVVSPARLTSTGRMNFPIQMSGDHRLIEIEGATYYPEAVFSEGETIPLAGCRENEIDEKI